MKNFAGRASINMDVTTLVSAMGVEAAEEMVYKIMSAIEQSAKAVFIDSNTDMHTFGVDHMDYEVHYVEEQEEDGVNDQDSFEINNGVISYRK
ncbi:hypothetical protein ABEY43_07210 [Priestia megaterium]